MHFYLWLHLDACLKRMEGLRQILSDLLMLKGTESLRNAALNSPHLKKEMSLQDSVDVADLESDGESWQDCVMLVYLKIM